MGTDYYPWDKSHAYSVIGLDEEYRRGGIAKSKVPGNKHVDLVKGYRLKHGYKAVKGADKDYNYAKGVAKLKVDKGWRLPHGYEVEEGAYDMKYKNGGGVEDIYKTEQEAFDINEPSFVDYMKKNKIESSFAGGASKMDKYTYVFYGTKPALKDMLLKYWLMDEEPNEAEILAEQQIEKDEQYRRGGVPGSKHVDLVKGYRLVHGYKAVKGADKDANYAKGVAKLKVDKGWRLPHGYEVADGAYDMKYKNGGGVDDYGTWRVKFWHSDTDKYKDVEVGGYDEDDAIENAKDRYDLDYLSGWSVVEANKLQYRTGGVAGSKHVDVTKGYRLVHGYRAVKGSDKQYNYSKGYPKVKVTPGYRLPHGYEIAEGAYNKKYDTGGNFDLTPEQYHRAVNHFIYFCFNYPNNFMDAFSSMKDHLQSKFYSIYDRVGAKAAMITFYTELDSENQKALLHWAMNNYKGTKLAEGGMLDVDVLSSFDIMKKGSNVNAKSSYVMLKGNRAYCGVHDKTYSEAVETAKSHACNSDIIIKGEMIWTNGRVKGIRLDDGTEMIYEQYEREFFTEPQLNELKKISKRK
jgi:hypothetical protein